MSSPFALVSLGVVVSVLLVVAIRTTDAWWPFTWRSALEREQRQVAWLYQRLERESLMPGAIRDAVRDVLATMPRLRPPGNPTLKQMDATARKLGLVLDLRPVTIYDREPIPVPPTDSPKKRRSKGVARSLSRGASE